MTNTLRHLDRDFWSKLVSIGFPVSLQSAMFSLLGVVDIFMVGQLGEAATAAVGVGNRVFFFNLVVIFGVSSAVSVLASQYYGAKNNTGIRVTLAQSWIAALLVTTPFCILYLVAPQSVVSLASDDVQYLPLASEYLLLTGASLFLTVAVVPLESTLRAVGIAKMPTYVSLVTIVVNVILNALLIFGMFGFPELGVAGAAIGTSLSRLFQTITLFYIARKNQLWLFPTLSDLELGRKVANLKRYIKIAAPMCLQTTFWGAGTMMYNIIIGQLGVTSLATISLLLPIEGVLISAFLGFSVAASIILGNEIGAKQYQRVEQTAWWYVIISTGLAAILAVFVLASTPYIEYLLSKSTLTDLDTALNVCVIMAFGLVLKVFNMVGIGGVLKSGGDINYTIFIDLFGQWGVGIPLAYYTGLILGWPLDWVLSVMLLDEAVKVVLLTQRIQSKKWINNLVEDSEIINA
ncbi:MATE family efflux transporter [Vibrio sonorensis]|uniref:MATE family efflux transporter n=1 Tax=Vibrio sonorensis TaxID=1004316 RepID=UPI0008D9AE8A|nr:MATE family efflux transporter [Vibrio sonorensis]